LVRKKIDKLEHNLKMLQLDSTGGPTAKMRILERELCELFEREEIMSRQHSRVDWLKEGKRNTTFYAKASARKCTNRINYLIREDGSRCDVFEEIKGMAHHFL
jgi:hypothetical protein